MRSLDLDSYNFVGKDKEWLRYAENWVTKRGFRIEEAGFKEYESEILGVSESWRATRTIKKKEVRFLSRPIVMNDELDVRRFFLFDAAGKIAAFVFFDPVYEAGRVTGYVTCIKRRQPDAPHQRSLGRPRHVRLLLLHGRHSGGRYVGCAVIALR